MSVQFQFPQSVAQIRSIRDLDFLKQYLTIQAGGDPSIRYRYLMRQRRYLYAKCQQCQSCLRFKYSSENEEFELTFYNKIHNHKIGRSRESDKLQQLLRQLPITIDQNTARKIILSQLNEKSSRFYYHYSKIFNSRLSFKKFATELDEAGCHIQYQPYELEENSLPSLLILVTPEMKEYYLKYSETVSIDFTFKLVKQKHSTGGGYKFGLILGSSLSKKIVPFALIIAEQETGEAYYRLLRAFGDIMGVMPKVIMTDDSPAASMAIRDLKRDGQFQGIHLLDIFHIIHNIRPKLHRKENISYFSLLAACSNKKNFETLLEEVYEKIGQQDIQILSKFIRRAQQYCFSQIQAYFIGFSSTTGMNQKAHDLIKSCMPFQKPMIAVIKKVLALSKKLLSVCQEIKIEKTPIEKYYNYSQIKEIRTYLDKRVMKQFCEQLSETISLELTSEEQNQLIVKDMKSGQFFKVEKREKLYHCQCQYGIKSGLICSHLLKICFIKKDRLLKYINPRWIRTSQLKLTFSVGRGYGTRKRRR